MINNPDMFDRLNPQPRTAADSMARVVFNNSTQRWRDTNTGRFVPEAQVHEEMRRHVSATFNTLERLTDNLYSGQITVQQWQVAVASELKDAHLAQAMFARGGKQNMTAKEWGRVGGVLADEYKYLNGFAQDIAAGKQSLAQAQARIRQYGKATQQAYWREYALDSKEVIYWNLNPAEHCQDCLQLAGGSPYRPEELPTYPGAGETRCRGNCNCTLSREKR